MNWWQWTKKFLSNQEGNLKQMLTPPKSKSPWEAMTLGSTGGWAKFGNEPIVKGAALLGAGALGGPGAAAGVGALMGYPGYKKSAGSQIMGTLGGAIGGYGMGSLGAGLAGGAKGLLAGGMHAQPSNWAQFTGGFGQGMQGYFGSPIIPGMAGTSGTNILSGAKNLLGLGGSVAPGATGTASGGARLAGMASGTVATPGQLGTGGIGDIFNLQNLSTKTLGGIGLLGASAMMQPPSIGTSPGRAMEAVQSPNLVEARSMMRDLAIMNPSELVNNKDVDKYIDATVGQAQKAYQQQRQARVNEWAAQGKTLGKSGSAKEDLARYDAEFTDSINKFIFDTKKSIYLAGINQKIQSVVAYYNNSEREALMMLEAYGYISPEDALQFEMEMKDYESTKQALGTVAGNLLAPQFA